MGIDYTNDVRPVKVILKTQVHLVEVRISQRHRIPKVTSPSSKIGTYIIRPQDLNKYSIKLEVPGDYQTLPLGKPDALYRVWVCKKLP